MQTSAMKARFQIAECSLTYAKLMQTSGKRQGRFQKVAGLRVANRPFGIRKPPGYGA